MSSGTTAAHAAKEKRKKREEEEEMTRYKRDELENEWEFKIVRSATGAFNKREKIEQIKAEEAQSGWVMVEKFDEHRIRFKRPLSAQKKDELLPYHVDPYRTTYGVSEAGLAFLIIGAVVLIGLLVLFLTGSIG